MPLSDNIKKYRLLRKLSVKELAQEMEVSRQTIYDWEKNLHSPSADDVERLAGIFKIRKILLYDDKHTDVADDSIEKEHRDLQRKYIERLERDVESMNKTIQIFRQRLLDAGLDTSVPE